MNITLSIGSTSVVAHHESGERHVAVPPFTCPACGQKTDAVLGAEPEIAGHDVYECDAHAACCMAKVGRLRVTAVPTVFGLSEDRAVLQGRARVYR